MIELGVGFHPDLTGRENIYLNTSLFRLSTRETDAIYDDIVDFAELEQFIDMPVKNYSTGMYARLGFAIAIHLAPEILLIDEVLAVGDEHFQKKCLERMERAARAGHDDRARHARDGHGGGACAIGPAFCCTAASLRTARRRRSSSATGRRSTPPPAWPLPSSARRLSRREADRRAC